MAKTTLCLTLLLLASALRASPQTAEPSQDKAVVEGTVINVQNSRGVAWARVTLRSAGQGAGGTRSIRADGNGHFIFEQVAPGTYRLSSTRPGFYSSVRPGASTGVVVVSEGQHLKDVLVRLLPTAAVFGQIVDENNDPMQDVSVRIMSREFRAGRATLTPAGKATTDDRGEYRLFDLRPGSYYLVADYRPARKAETVTLEVTPTSQARFAPPPPGRGVPAGAIDNYVRALGNQAPAEPAEEISFAYAPLFYPDTSDFQRAQVLTTHPGDEVHANFIMYTMPSVSIKGQVVNGLTGAPAPGAEVVASWTEYITGDGVSAGVNPSDGRFEVRDLAPGIYTLRTTFTEEGETYTDRRTFEVGIHGLENVVLAGMPDSIVTGHVILDNAGNGGDAANAPRRMVVSFSGPGNPSTIRAVAQATQATKLEFTAQLHPGDRYAVTALGLPQDYYLKAVRVAGHEVERDNLVIGGRRADLELVISPGGGHVEGYVADLKDQPRAGLVALFPDDRPITAETVRRIRADSKGHFAVSGLLPGSYRIFAFEDADLDELINEPDLLKQYSGESVAVSESGRYGVQLRLIPADSR